MKFALLIGGIMWLAQRPGHVEMMFNGMFVQMHFGVFIVGLLALMVFGMIVFSIVRGLANLPENIKRAHRIKRMQKGQRALMLGLNALAAGDAKIASYQAYRAKKFIDTNDNKDAAALMHMLEGQAFKMQGKDFDAEQSFEALAQNKDSAFLGLRGLLQSALDQQDYTRALGIAERAMELDSRQPWVLRVMYDLYLRERRWNAARGVLDKLERADALEASAARSDRVAMFIAQADEYKTDGSPDAQKRALKAALSLDNAFVPAICRLAALYKEQGKLSSARGLVEKGWAIAPHPDLGAMWDKLVDAKKKDDGLERLRHAEKLFRKHPESYESQIYIAGHVMAQSIWGEAKTHLNRAADFGGDTRLYAMLAECEKKSGGDEAQVEALLMKEVDAPKPKAWVCSQTGLSYSSWQPIAEPHGAFNTMRWMRVDTPVQFAPARDARLIG